MTFALAGPQDAPDIARLLADTTLPGWVSLSYRTAPGATGMPHPRAETQVLLGRAEGGAPAGMVAGMVTQSRAPAFLDGVPTDIAWLSQFRIAPFARRRVKLLARAFDAARGAFAQGPGWALASLLDGNPAAQRLLTAGLPGFPRLSPIGRLQTLILRSGGRGADTARQGRAADMAEVAAFVNAANAHRPLAPVVDGADLAAGRWPGLSPQDFLLLGPPGAITAAAALWDQRALRQIGVTGYRAPLPALRGLANALSPLTGLPRLPPPGHDLALGYLAFLTAPDAPRAQTLIAAARALGARRGLTCLALGLAGDDPLLPALLKNHRCLSYGSCIHAVTWQDDAHLPDPARFAGMKPEISLM